MAEKRPWSVKGIDPETRAAAKTAARRAGLTLGVWLSQAITGQATRDLKRDSLDASGSVAESQDMRGNQGSGDVHRAAAGLQSVLDAVRRLGDRLDASDERTNASDTALARRLDAVAKQVSSLRNRSAESITLIEQALISLNERLRKLERRRSAIGMPATGSNDEDAPEPSPSETGQPIEHDAPPGRLSRLFNRED